jgi:hypothetical protein
MWFGFHKVDPYHDASGKFTSAGAEGGAIAHDVEKARLTAIDKIKNAPSIPAGENFVSNKEAGGPSNYETVRPPTITTKLLKDSPVKTIPLDKVNTVQGYLTRSKLVGMLEANDLQALQKNKPLVCEQDGVYYLLDGNHRVAAMRLLGKKEADFIVVQAREPKSRYK